MYSGALTLSLLPAFIIDRNKCKCVIFYKPFIFNFVFNASNPLFIRGVNIFEQANIWECVLT